MKEMFLVNPDTRVVELYLGRDGKSFAATPDAEGTLRSAVLGLAFTTLPGPLLRVSGADVDVRF